MTDTTVAELRGILIHRALLHPLIIRFFFSQDDRSQRDRYVTSCEEFALSLEKALRGDDWPLAQALISHGGPSRADAVADYRRLRDSASADDIFGDYTACVTAGAKTLMTQAWNDDWTWALSEVAPLLRAMRGDERADDRIDMLVGRRAGAPLIVEIKTGGEWSDEERANAYLEEVHTKYAQPLAEDFGAPVAYQVMCLHTGRTFPTKNSTGLRPPFARLGTERTCTPEEHQGPSGAE